VSKKVSDAGNISVLEYLKQNTISNSINGRPLNIQPLKWLYQRGAANADRMVAYTKEQDKVRFPLVPLQRTPLEYRDIRQLTTYF
ncbi:major capsid family protein, partial [Acinetobacter baumannii]